MLDIISSIVEAAKKNNVFFCHWKSNQRLHKSVMGETDLDIWVTPEHELAFCEVLTKHGFVQFESRSWSRYKGVTDWMGVDKRTGEMVHIHLHNRLLTGEKGVKQYSLPWNEEMCESLILDDRSGIPIPSRGFEAHLLLTREAVKGSIIRCLVACFRGKSVVSRANQREMKFLKNEAGTEALSEWGVRLWGEDRWREMSPSFFSDEWHVNPHFAQLRKEVRRSLSAFCEADEIKTMLLMALFKIVRSFASLSAAILGTTVAGKRLQQRAPIIAIVGADGAGKTTIVEDICEWLAWKIDVKPIYLGSNHGFFKHVRSIVRRLRHGAESVDHINKDGYPLSPESDSTVSPADEPSRPLAWLQALKYYFFAVAKRWRLFWANRMREMGTLIISDRYPQTQFPGTYDGPSEGVHSQEDIFIRCLHSAELRHYQVMSKMLPDLVIKLEVPFDVALTRKPAHNTDALKRKTEITRRLEFFDAPVLSVLTTAPLEQVKVEVRNHVWNCIKSSAEKGSAGF